MANGNDDAEAEYGAKRLECVEIYTKTGSFRPTRFNSPDSFVHMTRRYIFAVRLRAFWFALCIRCVLVIYLPGALPLSAMSAASTYYLHTLSMPYVSIRICGRVDVFWSGDGIVRLKCARCRIMQSARIMGLCPKQAADGIRAGSRYQITGEEGGHGVTERGVMCAECSVQVV